MCGIIGAISDRDVTPYVKLGLIALPHRGQDSAGIIGVNASHDRFEPNATKYRNGSNGPMSKGQNDAPLERLLQVPMSSTCEIGHLRYSTSGGGDGQPLCLGYPAIAGGYNGQIANVLSNAAMLHRKGWVQQSTNDVEQILQTLGETLKHRPRHSADTERFVGESLQPALRQIMDPTTEYFINGAYSFVGIFPDHGLLGMRHQQGIKPLVYGEFVTQEGQRVGLFASETVAFDLIEEHSWHQNRPIHITALREVKPGEAVFVDHKLQEHSLQIAPSQRKACVVEDVYFSSPLSRDLSEAGCPSYYQKRLAIGDELFEENRERIAQQQLDVIVLVPDSGRPVAQRFAERAGLPLREYIIRNRSYRGRVFQLPEDERDEAFLYKFGLLRDSLEGQNVGVIDDSIIRADTTRNIIPRLRRWCRPKSVHLYVGLPLVMRTCPGGTDLADETELIAALTGGDREAIAKFAQADSATFLSIPGLARALKRSEDELCLGCLGREYATSLTNIGEYFESRKAARQQFRA